MTSAPRNLTAAISMMLSVSACSPVVSRSIETRIGAGRGVRLRRPTALTPDGSPGVLAMSRPRIQAQQHLTRGPGRPAPMADAMFFFGGEFRSGRTERRHVKDGIIAKAVFAAWVIGNDALHGAL